MEHKVENLGMLCLSKFVFCQMVTLTVATGEVLRGDRIVNTKFESRMKVPTSCTVMCKSQEFDSNMAKTIMQRIRDEYSVHL